MKLTKQKLEQLIMEEYKSMSRRIFDKQREKGSDGMVVPVGHEDRTIDYPEYADKLTALAKNDPASAVSLADSLDEPLMIPSKSGNEKTERILTPDQRIWH